MADEHHGQHSLGAALVQHLHDALDRHRERHGYTKRKESTMPDTVLTIMKDCGGPVAFAKTICDTARAYGVSSQEFVEAASRYESELHGLPGDRAFAKLCEREPVVMRACGVLKSAEFAVADDAPMVVGGEANRGGDVNPNNPAAAVRAYEEIVRIGRERFPFLPADIQFARIFEDKNYIALAREARWYTAPNSGSAYTTKSDSAPNVGSAYDELMHKAEELRSAQPGLSISQAFAEVFSDPANKDLAKRERIESTVR